ncbi:hypothetical protein QQZ08_001462 [Neonectria magnoliae]|uniref:Uncharacterized protein n=1 Tax=Neonectria magnoliae TaxID=2732573 RepID=A0ABR1IE58_9HYPO
MDKNEKPDEANAVNGTFHHEDEKRKHSQHPLVIQERHAHRPELDEAQLPSLYDQAIQLLRLCQRARVLQNAAGWTRSESPNDTVKNPKSTYVRHNKYVHTVPSEQLLDFQLSDGWEPLCRLLGKGIPDVPFPRVNDSVEYKARNKRLGNKIMKIARRLKSQE